MFFHDHPQFDLNCRPLVCVHTDARRRLICLWVGGLAIGRWVLRWSGAGALLRHRPTWPSWLRDRLLRPGAWRWNRYVRRVTDVLEWIA